VFLISEAKGAPVRGGSIFGGNYAMKRSGKLLVLFISEAKGAPARDGSIFGGNTP
jgi:hypothetical protein